MILPSNISSIMLHHLSLSHDEHTGIMRQQTSSGNSGLAKTSRMQVSNVSEQNLSRSKGVNRDNCVSKLNSLPVQNNSLRIQANRDCTTGKLNHDAVKEKQYNEKQGEQQSNKNKKVVSLETCLSELLEIQAYQTVIETAQTVMETNTYQSLFVSLIYRQIEYTTQELASVGQLMTVSPLEASNGQIHAHSTLLMPNGSGEVRTKQLNSQLVYGHPVEAPNWIFIQMDRQESFSDASWKLKTTGSYEPFTGMAVVIGDTPYFMQETAQISLHVPGANHEKNWLC